MFGLYLHEMIDHSDPLDEKVRVPVPVCLPGLSFGYLMRGPSEWQRTVRGQTGAINRGLPPTVTCSLQTTHYLDSVVHVRNVTAESYM